MNPKIDCLKCLLAVIFIFLPFIGNLQAQTPQNTPIKPCDFYGLEGSPGTLTVGDIVTAQDPDLVILGQFTVTQNGNYGFLTSASDDPTTPEDEGAVDGDIITFYINGLKQQEQAVFKYGKAIQVDLGISFEGAAFNLHLAAMPNYTNYQDDPRYSGVAVADMILDYLDSANVDTQVDLMAYADKNSDTQTSGEELGDLLSEKAPSVYHFSTSATVDRYSGYGLIGDFDATNQNDVLEQICHWMAYRVPDASQDRSYVPVAVTTSSNPATSADSDYLHWMSLVGVKTNVDPFPSLTDDAAYGDFYELPDNLEIYGVYLNDPGQSGLGFHTYVAADEWKTKYFRPLALGLENEGLYMAIFEPPEGEVLPVVVKSAWRSSRLQLHLSNPKKGVSIFIPGWVNRHTKRYLMDIFNELNESSDFNTLMEDPYFNKALSDARVTRCYKIDGTVADDYTIIPFDKQNQGSLATTAAIIFNNQTGQFRIAAGDIEAASLYAPLSWSRAYRALRASIGWRRQHPVNRWLHHLEDSPLYPGWSVVTVSYEHQGSVGILNSFNYSISNEEQVILADRSPEVELLGSYRFRSYNDWIKIVWFEITDEKEYTVKIDKKSPRTKTYIYRNDNRCVIILRGPKRSNCRVKITSNESEGNIRQGGVTYVYIRR